MNRPEVQGKGYSKYTAQKLPVNARHTNSQRGIARVIRENKRAEAEARQAASRPDTLRSLARSMGYPRISQAADAGWL